MAPYRIAVFASGSGTNAENIARYFSDSDLARVTVVLTNVRDAGVVLRMTELEIDTFYVPNKTWDNNPGQIMEFLKSRKIDLVVLAGFMHYVSPVILDAFPDMTLNIHPSLLPAFGGKGMWGHHVHEAVIAAGEKESGATVHKVTEEMDGGEIVMNMRCEVTPEDNAETLESKVHQLEYKLYPAAITKVLEERRAEGIPPASADPVQGQAPDNMHTDAQKDAPETVQETVEATTVTGADTTKKDPDVKWAETLGMDYNPGAGSPVPPPAPGAPQFNQQPNGQPQPGNQYNSQPYGQYNNNQPYGQYNQYGGGQYNQYRNPAAPYGNQPTSSMPPMPPTNLVWAVLSLVLCCFIPGIIAVIYASRVSSLYHSGDYQGSVRASNLAKNWTIASFVLGVLSNTLIYPIYMFLTM